MLPGPDQIVACPYCGALAKYMTLTSGNTFGARVWTDGKQIAPMLPRPPAVVHCKGCANCYWLSEAKEIGTDDHRSKGGGPVNMKWNDAQFVEEPTEEEYFKAIESGLAADFQQERTLRVLAWWRRNDAFRDRPEKKTDEMATAKGTTRTNLEALLQLMQEDDENERLMRAEVLRELGEFESSKQTLDGVTSADFMPVVRQLRSLCDAGDTTVQELQFGD